MDNLQLLKEVIDLRGKVIFYPGAGADDSLKSLLPYGLKRIIFNDMLPEARKFLLGENTSGGISFEPGDSYEVIKRIKFDILYCHNSYFFRTGLEGYANEAVLKEEDFFNEFFYETFKEVREQKGIDWHLLAVIDSGRVIKNPDELLPYITPQELERIDILKYKKSLAKRRIEKLRSLDINLLKKIKTKIEELNVDNDTNIEEALSSIGITDSIEHYSDYFIITYDSLSNKQEIKKVIRINELSDNNLEEEIKKATLESVSHYPITPYCEKNALFYVLTTRNKGVSLSSLANYKPVM